MVDLLRRTNLVQGPRGPTGPSGTGTTGTTGPTGPSGGAISGIGVDIYDQLVIGGSGTITQILQVVRTKWQVSGNLSYTYSDQPADTQTTNDTLTTVYSVPLISGTTAVAAEIVGTKSNQSDGALMTMKGAWLNNNGSISALLAGTVVTNTHGTWTPHMTVSSTNLLVQVSGSLGTTINWATDVTVKVRP